MSKHTPGPWSAIPDSSDSWNVQTDKEAVVARGLYEPDAHLLAAAPDLLAALKLVEPYVSLDHLGEVHAAIAKAEGTS